MSRTAPLFIWKAGWQGPLGPYETEAEARTEAEVQAQQRPGEIIYLLEARATVEAPAPTPIWDDGS